MDGEAQGKASHGCMPSKPVACLGLMGSGSGLLSQLWGGGHHTEGSTGDPSSLRQRPGPSSFCASWNLPSPDAVPST